ncbi:MULTISPECIES: hypothetical protein [unclassified Pseudofrankia]|uniref:hypothetical protein n=1 Tax=unclassified Pseudofrankia TaxID=2994372 RepID=UPI0012FF5AFD|nr:MULTISPECIES: hypothetical protein [unclassified Pseudofrankia]MDT3439426.1 hypothetical protein [Pseudofrankia sp. BMG5.37]
MGEGVQRAGRMITMVAAAYLDSVFGRQVAGDPDETMAARLDLRFRIRGSVTGA